MFDYLKRVQDNFTFETVSNTVPPPEKKAVVMSKNTWIKPSLKRFMRLWENIAFSFSKDYVFLFPNYDSFYYYLFNTLKTNKQTQPFVAKITVPFTDVILNTIIVIYDTVNEELIMFIYDNAENKFYLEVHDAGLDLKYAINSARHAESLLYLYSFLYSFLDYYTSNQETFNIVRTSVKRYIAMTRLDIVEQTKTSYHAFSQKNEHPTP